jgi:hypothetical protein
MRDLDALGMPAGIAGQHDMAAARQEPRQALERPAAHDHRRAHGEPLEASEILGNAPGHAAVPADHAILGAGDDEGDDGRGDGHGPS